MSVQLRGFSVLLILFILIPFSNIGLALGDEAEALSRISEAEAAIDASYLSLLELYRKGADVSNLAAFLNVVLDYYSVAVVALESGDYETVNVLSERIVKHSDLFLEPDVSFEVDYYGHVDLVTFRNQLFISLESACLIVLFGLFGWKLFRSYYIKKMMNLRPEVPEDEP